jgi:glyoxylase-like metal-dependent hydrolase (beta-lactamase superfamily II)
MARAAALAVTLTGAARAQSALSRAPEYEVYAIRYASIPFRVNGLIAGADTSRRLDIAMMVWLIKGPNNRNILVDAGFYRPAFMAQWKPQQYVRPDSALAVAGLRAEDITDVIISHIHWDHFDGADLFPKARIWIQREEVAHHIDSAGKVLAGALSRIDAPMLDSLRRAGRVQLVGGDAQEIIPGVTVYTGGKHTFQSQYAAVRVRGGVVVLASDNAYLYENLEQKRPIAQTLDSLSNLAAQARMKTLASRPDLVVPGHDPAVFTRFPEIKPGLVRIR